MSSIEATEFIGAATLKMYPNSDAAKNLLDAFGFAAEGDLETINAGSGSCYGYYDASAKAAYAFASNPDSAYDYDTAIKLTGISDIEMALRAIPYGVNTDAA